MNVNEFREDLLEQIRFAFSADGTSDREAFLSCVSEMLVEAEENRAKIKEVINNVKNNNKETI